MGFPRGMGRAEALRIPGVRAARRCFLYVGQAMEDEIIVVDASEFYAVGTVLDEWYIVPASAQRIRQFLAALLGVKEEEIELNC
jgi:hypothetical protein